VCLLEGSETRQATALSKPPCRASRVPSGRPLRRRRRVDLAVAMGDARSKCEAISRTGKVCPLNAIPGTRACHKASHQLQVAAAYGAGRTEKKRWKLATLAGLALSAFALLPRLEIEYREPLDSNDALSTIFDVENEGYLPLFAARATCHVVSTSSKNTSFHDFILDHDERPATIRANASIPASCEPPFAVVDRSRKRLPRIDSEVIVDVWYWVLPLQWLGVSEDLAFQPTAGAAGDSAMRPTRWLTCHDQRLFASIADSEGRVRWYEKALGTEGMEEPRFLRWFRRRLDELKG
jgi:hypothetical protein